jgi:hypothetical protein
MAIYNLRDASVVYNAVDISNRVRSVKITMNADDLDATAMGALSHAHVPGLRNDEVELELFQDHAVGSIDATFSALLGNSAGATLVVKPTSGAVSTSNPSFTVTAIVLDYSAIDGEVGELSMTSITLVPAPGSSIVRATA